jgi:hypothetical protein
MFVTPETSHALIGPYVVDAEASLDTHMLTASSMLASIKPVNRRLILCDVCLVCNNVDTSRTSYTMSSGANVVGGADSAPIGRAFSKMYVTTARTLIV